MNLKNKYSDLETWELESHMLEIKTINQIPVDYNEKKQNVHKYSRFLFNYRLSVFEAFMLYGAESNRKGVLLALFESLVSKDKTYANRNKCR
jgi:hypothetical protein